MKQITVTFGGTSYQVEELPARRNAAWRKELETHLQPIIALLEQAGAGMELANSDDLLRLINQLLPTLLHAPELLITLISAYTPVLPSALLEEAYDSEIAEAFMRILGLAFPFGGLITGLSSLASGSLPTASPRTSTNSPLQNGVKKSPTTSMTTGA